MVEQAGLPVRDPRGRLAGKVALIVGAGCAAPGWGNGNAVAALFAREGASVFCVDRSEEAANATAALIAEQGGLARAAAGDATSLEDMRRVADACITAFGRIDVLHNNVGGSLPGGVADVEEETWDRLIELNLNTAFKACKAVLPHMIAQKGGAIVNVSSLSAVSFIEPISAAYAAAKAGMLQMSRLIAMQHVNDAVRSNSIVVGHVDTAEIRRRITARFGPDKLEQVLAIRAASTRNGRNATPWDIANAALYLASDEASYVTGSEIYVDGGISISHIRSYMADAEAALGSGAAKLG
jgi:NAD(P)-dependent dehydrogenase (short-subunit alcohol dehydrogenase family)